MLTQHLEIDAVGHQDAAFEVLPLRSSGDIGAEDLALALASHLIIPSLPTAESFDALARMKAMASTTSVQMPSVVGTGLALLAPRNRAMASRAISAPRDCVPRMANALSTMAAVSPILIHLPHLWSMV